MDLSLKRVLYAPAVIMGVSMAMSVAGGIAQGMAQKDQGEAEATYLRQQADQERIALDRDLTDQDRESSRSMARARAVLAAQGGDTTTGGALDLLTTQSSVYGEQRQRLISDSDARIKGLNMRADSASRAGTQAMWGSIFGGIGKGLSSGMSMFGGPSTAGGLSRSTSGAAAP